ncbi:MAG: LLM class flavin-dependent oxidoreductase [Chloroflexi bacterium]|nr:MAG: LLM class flavin-dependent oxidoreductase [Chloroflexota bacterium]
MPAGRARPPVSPDRLRLGLVLPTWTTNDVRWSEVLDIAGVAAEVGFDALYVSDHLLLPSNNAELKRRAGVDFPDDPEVELEGYMECFTTIAALAVAIPRLELGSFDRLPQRRLDGQDGRHHRRHQRRPPHPRRRIR